MESCKLIQSLPPTYSDPGGVIGPQGATSLPLCLTSWAGSPKLVSVITWGHNMEKVDCAHLMLSYRLRSTNLLAHTNLPGKSILLKYRLVSVCIP